MTDLLYRAHTCACSTGKALSGSWIARWMDKILSAGATKRANELLAARKAYDDAKKAYDAAGDRRDCRRMGDLWLPMSVAHRALLKAEKAVEAGR